MRNPIKSLLAQFKSKAPSRSQGGFTLVEISIVMLILGISVASFLHLYSTYIVQTRMEQTEVNRKLITLSLDEFKRRYGRYPCPARYDVARDNPEYGKEGNCLDVSVAPGVCTDGICVEESEREVTLKDNVTKVFPRVRRGALPFRDMYLAEDLTYDKYKGRFSYAVTELLTLTDSFDIHDGGISVVDNDEPVANSLVDPAGSALYFVFSHGPDNYGAYNYQGQLMVECNGTMHDNENCNTSSLHAKAIYRHAPASTALVDDADAGVSGPPTGPPVTLDANTHYDDFASYVAKEDDPLWKYSEVPDNEENIHDLLEENQVLDFGTPDAVTDPDLVDGLKVNVGGDVRAGEKSSAADYCNPDKEYCTQAYRIGGTGMTECVESGNAGIGVAYNKILCGDKASLAISCDPDEGKFMTGIDSEGQPICKDIAKPVPCSATTKKLCGINKTIAESPSGTAVTLTAGASFSQTWTCQGSKNPKWKLTNESGVCNCTPGSVTSGPQACGAAYGNSTYTTTTTTVCPSGQTSQTDTYGQTCICTPYTRTRTQPCGGNLSGGIEQTSNVTCSNGSPVNGPWTNVPGGNSCQCTLPATDVDEDECPNELDGTITYTRQLNAQSCSYGQPTVVNSCTCNSKDPQVKSFACPSPTTGTYKRQKLFQCPAGTWSGWMDLPNEKETNCKCINEDQTRFVESCTAPQTGGHTEKRTVDCYGNPVSGTAGQWTMVGTKDCKSPPPPPVCKWGASATAVGPVGLASNPKATSVCACGTADALCYVGVGGQFFQGYQCSCGQ